jgi:hypothetical protein
MARYDLFPLARSSFVGTFAKYLCDTCWSFTISLVDILRPACDAHIFHCLFVFEVAGVAEYIFKFWCLEVGFVNLTEVVVVVVLYIRAKE